MGQSPPPRFHLTRYAGVLASNAAAISPNGEIAGGGGALGAGDAAASMGHAEQEPRRAIALLQERRTALISAAVTGQIDVRPLCQ